MSRQDEAQRLLGFDKAVFLISINEDGQPDARAMAIGKSDGLKTIWMSTGKDCDKYRQLSKNSSCMLYATDLPDTDNKLDAENYLELRLWGRIEILDDADSKALVWRDDYFEYFPSGPSDPNLCVLKFTTDHGMLQTQAGKEKLSL